MKLAWQYHGRALGGEWSQVTRMMLEHMGQSAKTRVSKWVRAARYMPVDLQNALAEPRFSGLKAAGLCRKSNEFRGLFCLLVMNSCSTSNPCRNFFHVVKGPCGAALHLQPLALTPNPKPRTPNPQVGYPSPKPQHP